MSIDQPHDLRAFFHSVGRFSGERALTAAIADRPQADVDVELLDPAQAVEVQAEPMRPAGFVDGIQAALLVTYRQHRPVYLNYTAAGCLSADGRIVGMHEDMFVSGCEADEEWYYHLSSTIPWVTVPAIRPDEIAGAATAALGSRRDELERELVSELAEAGHHPLVVDGSLATRVVSDSLVGVVKTTRRRYLPDESLLWGMPAGHRSPRFRMPAGSQGSTVDRYSCYLRLHDARDRAWDFGLVRLEAYDPDLLEPLAALALRERQSSQSRDARFDRHLAGVRAVEDALRAHRPPVFTL